MAFERITSDADRMGGLPVTREPSAPTMPEPCMLICMHSTSVRIDSTTHEELKLLADQLGTTVGHTVTLAVRALRQDRLGDALAAPLSDDERRWLDADLG